MTQPPEREPDQPPPGPDPAPAGEAPPEIVQWGNASEPRPARPSPLARLAGWRGPGRAAAPVAWLLAGAGGLALGASLLADWQVTTLPEEFIGDEVDEFAAGVASVDSWGAGWLVGVLALAACAVLTLRGLPALRPAARSVGLALAVADLGLLVAMSIQLNQVSVLQTRVFLSEEFALDTTLGPGAYLAYLGLALVAAGVWWARPGYPGTGAWAQGPGLGGAGGRGGGYGGPPDLTVGPAEPFTYLGDDQRER